MVQQTLENVPNAPAPYAYQGLVISENYFCIPEIYITPNNIHEYCKGPQRKFLKEDYFEIFKKIQTSLGSQTDQLPS